MLFNGTGSSDCIDSALNLGAMLPSSDMEQRMVCIMTPRIDRSRILTFRHTLQQCYVLAAICWCTWLIFFPKNPGLLAVGRFLALQRLLKLTMACCLQPHTCFAAPNCTHSSSCGSKGHKPSVRSHMLTMQFAVAAGMYLLLGGSAATR